MKKPLVVFIEGADGVGKSSITNGIIRALAGYGISVAATHLIKHTRTGSALHLDFTTGEITDLPAMISMLGVTTATLQDFCAKDYKEEVIIVDRSQASFYAYQMVEIENRILFRPLFIQTLTAEFYKKYNYITIYLECDSNVAIERIKSSRGALDAIESLGVEFQDRIKANYDHCFNMFEKLRPNIRINTEINDAPSAVNLALDLIKKQMSK